MGCQDSTYDHRGTTMASYGKQTPSIQLVTNYLTNAQLIILRWLEKIHSKFQPKISFLLLLDYFNFRYLQSVSYTQFQTHCPEYWLTSRTLRPQTKRQLVQLHYDLFSQMLRLTTTAYQTFVFFKQLKTAQRLTHILSKND